MKTKKSFVRGWAIVAFCFFGFFLTTFYDILSPNVFVPALASAHGFDQGKMMMFHSMGGILGCLFGFYLGKLIESKGAKIILVITAIVSGINFALIGVATTELWCCIHIFLNEFLVLG